MNAPDLQHDLDAALNTSWDIIIVGTGIGGATLGLKLAQAGHKVLFLEKGRSVFSGPRVVEDDVQDPGVRLGSGYWPTRISFTIDCETKRVFAPLGCGVGGSSLLYAAALERFEPSDFESIAGQWHPTDGWPVSWEGMVPFYKEAEVLYGVAGTPDPLSNSDQSGLLTPPRASPLDDQFIDDFRKAGLHPYRLHVGIRYKKNCFECGGSRCVLRCKNDASIIGLEPALRTGNAMVLADCEVTRIVADANRADAVEFTFAKQSYRVRGRVIVLSAGAYHSPALMLKSKSEVWPEGLANTSGMIGRNLMFHANEWLAVWPRKRASEVGPRKTISLRDFYLKGGNRLGIFQSTAMSAGFTQIYNAFLHYFNASPFRKLRPFRHLLRVPAKLLHLVLGKATIFTMIIEDLPYPENRVVLDENGGIRVEYTIPNELRQRTRLAKQVMRRSLGLRTMSMHRDVQLNFGHPCGTCRFGEDPSSSVLDPTCKVHGLDNLYVVDASFMPTSGGANPSLTIAANALRVGSLINESLHEQVLLDRA